jgi:hypothetical protein
MGHKWHFFRAGGVEQVSIRNGADLLALPELDQKLWMALAIPSKGIDVEPRTLELLDHDHDGRVRVPDVLDAVQWIGKTWKSADDVLEGGDSLPVDAIKDPTVLAAALRVLTDVGQKGSATISLAQVTSVADSFAHTKLNGDGIVTPSSTDDAALAAVIEDILAAQGSVTDRSGKPGIDQAKADAFFADVDKLAAWIADGAAHRVLGDGTAAAADALAAVKAKIEDYFARCQLVAYDPRAAAGLNGQEADFTALGAATLTSGSPEIARLPLAHIDAASKGLPLRGAVNPAWAGALSTFADAAVKPALGKGRETLTPDDYAKVVEKLAGFVAWRAARPATSLQRANASGVNAVGGEAADKLDEARIQALASGDARAKVNELIGADKAREGEYGAIASVEKLLRLQRDFGRVLRNFVNFSDFYSKRDGAFQYGTVYLDGRAFKLVVPVGDAGKHAQLAGMAATHLIYCDAVRGTAKQQIAVAITNGDADNIFVGRNGVFYDRAGDLSSFL